MELELSTSINGFFLCNVLQTPYKNKIVVQSCPIHPKVTYLPTTNGSILSRITPTKQQKRIVFLSHQPLLKSIFQHCLLVHPHKLTNCAHSFYKKTGSKTYFSFSAMDVVLTPDVVGRIDDALSVLRDDLQTPPPLDVVPNEVGNEPTAKDFAAEAVAAAKAAAEAAASALAAANASKQFGDADTAAEAARTAANAAATALDAAHRAEPPATPGDADAAAEKMSKLSCNEQQTSVTGTCQSPPVITLSSSPLSSSPTTPPTLPPTTVPTNNGHQHSLPPPPIPAANNHRQHIPTQNRQQLNSRGRRARARQPAVTFQHPPRTANQSTWRHASATRYNNRTSHNGLSEREHRLANERLAAERRRHNARQDAVTESRRIRELRLYIGRYLEDKVLEVFGATAIPGVFSQAVNTLRL